MSGRKRPQTKYDEEDFSNQDQDSNLDRARLLRNLIWLIPVLFASFLLILGSLYIHTNLGSEHIHGARNVLFRAAENLKSHPIVDIEAKKAAENCSADFEEVVLGRFGAIEGGCLCQNGSVHSRAYCALHAFSSECALVKGNKEQEVKVFNTFKICVKRNKGFRATKDSCSGNEVANKCFSHYCIPTGEFCGYNKKTAGDENSGNAALLLQQKEGDFEGRVLSINHSHHASINTVHAADTATEKAITFPDVTPAWANGLKIKYDSADTSLPFVGFEFVTGDKPCWNNRLREEKQSKKSYALLEIKETGCGEFNTFDDVVTIVKNQLKYQTFIEKANLATSLNKEKFFDASYTDADLLSLVAVRRIAITPTDPVCYNINPDEVRKLDDQIETLKSTLNGIFIAVIVVVSLSLLIAIVFYVMKDKTYFHFDFRTRSSSKILTILGVIAAILVIVGGSIYYSRETNVQHIQGQFQTYVDKQCFDNYQTSLVKAFKTIINFANDQHGDLANIAKASFYSGIGFIVITVVLLVLKQKTGTPLFEGPFRDD